ncbi:MAG: cobalt ECF transporter T component CbiQ [Acidobacteriota bacterium]|nr:cobalt ECF transporter T component CbiQ [Acidobacteriota bacterium]
MAFIRYSRGNRSFIERTLASFAGAMEHALDAGERAKTHGMLQRLDPRMKTPGLLALIVAAAMARRLGVILALIGLAIAMAAFSRVPVRVLAARVWAPVLLFTGLIALPAPFLTPGRVLGYVPLLHWQVTAQGAASAAYLITRVEAAASFSALLVFTTPWPHVLKALRVLRAPVILVFILGMTYRYLFLLLQTAREMFEARQSRMIGVITGAERRRMAAASAGVLLSKSVEMSSDVFQAMQSRGFSGDVWILDDFSARAYDWLMLLAFGALAGAAIWLGR